MEFESVDAAWVIDVFLLLLIGIGPKIALVPFLEATAGMPAVTKNQVVRKMITTAATVAVALMVLGGLLTRCSLLSTGCPTSG
jgi:small neutral amino acid transporter SnatA (MarC family)